MFYKKREVYKPFFVDFRIYNPALKWLDLLLNNH